MKRRELLIGAGAMVAAMTVGEAAQAATHDHSGHHQGPDYSALIDAAMECQKLAMACEKHCLETFAMGDTTLAKCAQEVNEMINVCDATSRAAAMDAAYTKQIVTICKQAGETCLAECTKHAKRHDVCRLAAEACQKCITECDKVLL
ncbi:MAG: Csp1 family four helix bundle copper storage protein [Nitrospinota bacterium]|nr:Csp1 family four helix bundle copper storage protein [Nitrospinota bacterium]